VRARTGNIGRDIDLKSQRHCLQNLKRFDVESCGIEITAYCEIEEPSGNPLTNRRIVERLADRGANVLEYSIKHLDLVRIEGFVYNG
jgi:hypothetical protein